MNSVEIFLEIGQKKTFAIAVEWPGWSRSGRDKAKAQQALVDYGRRYAQVLAHSGLPFQPPAATSDLTVVERQDGSATTDFGVPAMIPAADKRPFTPAEFVRSRTILQACWYAFDTAMQQAAGKELRKGPRGGGRDVDKIIDHLLQADKSYLPRLAWKHKIDSQAKPAAELGRMRQAVLDALDSAAHNQLPEKGPRGGVIWPPRYFVRRVAWHTLDHAWEIEDRIV